MGPQANSGVSLVSIQLMTWGTPATTIASHCTGRDEEGRGKERSEREGRERVKVKEVERGEVVHTAVSAAFRSLQATSSLVSMLTTVEFSANHWSMALTMTWQAIRELEGRRREEG